MMSKVMVNIVALPKRNSIVLNTPDMDNIPPRYSFFRVNNDDMLKKGSYNFVQILVDCSNINCNLQLQLQ